MKSLLAVLALVTFPFLAQALEAKKPGLDKQTIEAQQMLRLHQMHQKDFQQQKEYMTQAKKRNELQMLRVELDKVEGSMNKPSMVRSKSMDQLKKEKSNLEKQISSLEKELEKKSSK